MTRFLGFKIDTVKDTAKDTFDTFSTAKDTFDTKKRQEKSFLPLQIVFYSLLKIRRRAKIAAKIALLC